jgi:hypothetical protein
MVNHNNSHHNTQTHTGTNNTGTHNTGTHTTLPIHTGGPTTTSLKTTTPITSSPVKTGLMTTSPTVKGGYHKKGRRGSHKKMYGGNCSGSANQWQLQNLGTLSQQLSRTFDPNLGNTATQSTNAISSIANPNAANNWKGGKKRGGNLGAIAYEALTPGILLATQNMYKLKRSRSNKKTLKSKKRKTRGGNFASLLGQAAVPGILLATQNMYRKKNATQNIYRKKTNKNKSKRLRK